jgi:ribosome-binding factor A
MSQGARPDRVADQIRGELGQLLARDVHDPGIGFVTITRVQVTADLQQARVFYTSLGDATAQHNSARALDRAAPFLRRQIGSRLRLRRVPELTFFVDESIAGQDRIEQLLKEIRSSAVSPDQTVDEPSPPIAARADDVAEGGPEEPGRPPKK